MPKNPLPGTAASRVTGQAAKLENLFRSPLTLLMPGGDTITVPPPGVEDSKALLAAVAATFGYNDATGMVTHRCESCGQVLIADQAIAEGLNYLDGRSVEEIALSTPVYKKLVADKVDGVAVSYMGLYAALYWTQGEAAADAWVEAATQTSEGEGDAQPPKR